MTEVYSKLGLVCGGSALSILQNRDVPHSLADRPGHQVQVRRAFSVLKTAICRPCRSGLQPVHIDTYNVYLAQLRPEASGLSQPSGICLLRTV